MIPVALSYRCSTTTLVVTTLRWLLPEHGYTQRAPSLLVTTTDWSAHADYVAAFSAPHVQRVAGCLLITVLPLAANNLNVLDVLHHG